MENLIVLNVFPIINHISQLFNEKRLPYISLRHVTGSGNDLWTIPYDQLVVKEKKKHLTRLREIRWILKTFLLILKGNSYIANLLEKNK